MVSVAPIAPPVESVQAARDAGLRYVTDASPGLRRIRAGKGFRYADAAGRAVKDPAVLQRIARLAVPPAWTAVWICADPQGHLQATGRDARGRKQHRYHPRWREVRDETKYDRLIAFAEALPKLRARCARDLALPGLPRDKVLATVVGLLETTLIRVGNEEYARANRSYGLTTLRGHHVRPGNGNGAALRFEFRGKSGVEHQVDVHDRGLARIVKQCKELPGQELFQYIDDDGARRAVGSADVNDYLRSACGGDFSAKDFRTWSGTVLAARALRELPVPRTQTQAKKQVAAAIEAVAGMLGNTRTVCRKSYVHPAIVDAYLEHRLTDELRPRRGGRGHKPDEAAVLGFLRRLATPQRRQRA